MKEKSSNKLSLKLSVTMMKKLRYLSHIQGIEVDDLLLDMIIENIHKRISKIQNKSMPSNLITRNGYLNEIYR